jgi:hypothetical protein
MDGTKLKRKSDDMNILNAALGTSVLLVGLSGNAQTPTPWHTVLICDGGAAVVDNRDAFENHGLGGYTPDVEAQVIIRSPQIVQYFISALNMQPGNSTKPFTEVPLSYYNSSGGAWVNQGQWISNSASSAAGKVLTSFKVFADAMPASSDNAGLAVEVNYDDLGLSVLANNWNVETEKKYSANWHFHNCVRR